MRRVANQVWVHLVAGRLVGRVDLLRVHLHLHLLLRVRLLLLLVVLVRLVLGVHAGCVRGRYLLLGEAVVAGQGGRHERIEGLLLRALMGGGRYAGLQVAG